MSKIKKGTLRGFGHVERLKHEMSVNRIFDGNGKRSRGKHNTSEVNQIRAMSRVGNDENVCGDV